MYYDTMEVDNEELLEFDGVNRSQMCCPNDVFADIQELLTSYRNTKSRPRALRVQNIEAFERKWVYEIVSSEDREQQRMIANKKTIECEEADK